MVRNNEEQFEHLRNRTVENWTGCWLWVGSVSKQGYGTVGWKNKNWQAHRLMYTLTVGKIEEGLLIRHLCGNRLCCNPTHLATGTYGDNSADTAKHGNCYFTNKFAGKTEVSDLAMFTEEQVYQIREMFASEQYTTTELGAVFSTSSTVICSIVIGDYYKAYQKVPPFRWQEKKSVLFRDRLTDFGKAKVIQMFLRVRRHPKYLPN